MLLLQNQENLFPEYPPYIQKWKDQLNALLAANTGQPLDKVVKDTDRDYYMNAEESVGYGVVDEVVARKPIREES